MEVHGSAARLRPRAPPAPARDDIHEHDQGDDDYRSNRNDGNGGRSDHHASVLSRDLRAKPAAPKRAGSTVAQDLAILGPVSEIDASGARREGLDAFLDKKLDEGYVIETRTHTHAVISRRPKGLKRFTSGADPGRYVVEVDENGLATMRPAEPRRT